jgi:hypothetical protein
MSATGKESGEGGWAAGMHAGSVTQQRPGERPLKWICARLAT